MRIAIVLLSVLALPALAYAQPEPAGDLLERARAADARADHAVAVSLYRELGRACLTRPTAVLDSPCAVLPAALSRAFELAHALGDVAAAEDIAGVFREHLLYAHPREAMRVGYELVRMRLEAGDLEAAEDALDTWQRLDPDPVPAAAILADALRARIAAAGGHATRAAHYRRRVDRRFRDVRDQLTDEGPIPLRTVREAVAEARLLGAEPFVERFLASRAPRAARARDAEELWRRVITPWRVRTERRLLLARMALERVYELGSPAHSVVAAARIGEMYEHLAELHDALPLPDDEWFRVLVRRGEDRPGYDEALAHLETCVRWAHHHGVAPSWARRCEESLHTLDPRRYPLPDELAGQASYMPVAVAPRPLR